MKITTLLFLECLLLALFTSCATAAQETPLPPTTTPVPATYTPEPTSCEEVEGICLELSFDGESCVYEGPADLNPGPVKLIFHNEGDGWAATNLIRLLEDKTLEDINHLYREEPSTQHQPLWSETMPGVWKELRAGESRFWEGDLEPGIYVLFCVRTPPWPELISVWIGKTWTIGY